MRSLVAVVVAACALASCSLARPIPPIRYYTLSVPGEPAAQPAHPIRLGVFTTDQPYATERIAYRTSPYRLDYYTYHRWAADPRRLIATAIRDYLDRGAPPSSSNPGLEVDGHIRRLEEVDSAGGWQGALVLDLKVRRGGEVLLERSYVETEPAEARNPEAVAAALSRALGRVIDRLIAELPASTSS